MIEVQYLTDQEVEKKLLEATNSNNPYEFAIKLIYGDLFDLPIRITNAIVMAYGKEGVENLINAIELIESYNNFKGKELAKVLRELHNKGLIMDLGFGREDSPVVYVKPPYWTHQASNYQGEPEDTRRITDEERKEMFKEIMEKLNELSPDEIYIKDASTFPKVRAWWD
jgi:hypothetical protein